MPHVARAGDSLTVSCYIPVRKMCSPFVSATASGFPPPSPGEALSSLTMMVVAPLTAYVGACRSLTSRRFANGGGGGGDDEPLPSLDARQVSTRQLLFRREETRS
jgi:hypothetical protein